MDTTSRDAAAYEGYIGRWSRVVARDFIGWLDVPLMATWHDVACGTGAIASVVLATRAPARVDGSDLDEARIAFARATISDPRATFRVGGGTRIDAADDTYDAIVNGLGFPPIRETANALAEFRRVTKPGGIVAGYVWDFDGEMQLLRYFWDAASDLEAGAEDEEDLERFAICRPDRLEAAWRDAGLTDVSVRAIDAPARFENFEDFWTPFLSGDSPAQTHVQGLDATRRAALRERLQHALPIERDGSIPLVTRAWAARGTKPHGTTRGS